MAYGDDFEDEKVARQDEDLERHPHDPEPEAYWQSVRDAAEEPAVTTKLTHIPDRDSKGRLIWLRPDGRRH